MKNARSIVKVASVLTCLLASFLSAKIASAASGYSSRTEWGARDIAANSKDDNLGYNRSISGASWYYYKITGSNYQEGEKIYIPVSNGYTPKVAIPAKTCQEYGGFWALLRNEYDRKTGELTNRPAAAIKLSDIRSGDLPEGLDIPATNIITFKNRTGKPEDTGSGIDAEKYGSMGEVLTIYTKYSGTTAIPAAANNIGELSYFCASEDGEIPKQQPIPLHSFSTVTVAGGATSAPVLDGTSYMGGNNTDSIIAVPVGNELPSITFRFYIARAYSEYKLGPDGATIEYQVSDVAKSINADSLNQGDSRWNIGGTNYLYLKAHEITVENPGTMGGDKQTICQKITLPGNNAYESTSLKLTRQPSINVESQACITFVPVPATEINGNVVTDCEQGGNGRYTYYGYPQQENHYIGNTVATVGVSKNNGDLVTTTAAAVGDGMTKTIYAKPGDVIRFSYAICFGANDVNYEGRIVTAPDGPSAGNQIDSRFRVYLGTEGNDQVRAYALLFGNQNKLLNSTIYADKRSLREGKFKYNYSGANDSSDSESTSGIDSSEEYQITDPGYWNGSKRQLAFSSPDAHEDVSIQIGGGSSSSQPDDEETEGEGGDTDEEDNNDEEDSNNIDSYGCAYYNGLSSGQSTGYVIPGFEGTRKGEIDCDSAFSNSLEDSDGVQITSAVGATISHSLEYPYIAAWPTYDTTRTIVTGLETINKEYNKAYDQIMSGQGSILANSPGRAVSSGNLDDETVTKTAKVAIPYNFDTNITGKITNNESQIVYPGDTLEYSATVDILPRKNPLTSDKDGDSLIPYATTMPPSAEVDLVEFIIKDTADSSIAEMIKQDYQSPDKTESRICKYYSKILNSNYVDCESRAVKGAPTVEGEIGNGTSNPEGQKNYYNGTTKFVVPDIEAGYKYCVAVAISHGDSHGFPGEDLSTNPEDPNYAANSTSVKGSFSTSTGYHWRTANASCRTVAKRPSFQAWNSGVYSSNNITTSTTLKSVNARLGNLPPGTKLEEGDTRKIAADPVYFGSWAEYYVVAKGEITGFASAAALGFTTTYGSLTTDGYGVPRGNDYCNFSRLTIANDSCERNVAGGYAAVLAPQSATKDPDAKDLKKEISDFYVPPASEIGLNSYISPGSISGSDVQRYATTEWNGANVLLANGDLTIQGDPISWSSGTLVIKVNGHLTINNNICLGDGTCKDAGNDQYSSKYLREANNLSLSARNATLFKSINEIPQVIIIAESIGIGSDVSQIDAWLITSSDKADYDGGYVNTCNEFQPGKTGVDKCWKTLKINGPVVTTALLLNRTGGAWPGYSGDIGNQAYETLREEKAAWKRKCDDGTRGAREITECVNDQILDYVNKNLNDNTEREAAIAAYAAVDRYGAQFGTYSAGNSLSRDLSCDGSTTPAEIFDLHPIVYYWAYAQSQKLAQAIITYAQELAPRY